MSARVVTNTTECYMYPDDHLFYRAKMSRKDAQRCSQDIDIMKFFI